MASISRRPIAYRKSALVVRLRYAGSYMVVSNRRSGIWFRGIRRAGVIANDSNGSPLPQGLYIYVTEVSGGTTCEGTITIAR